MKIEMDWIKEPWATDLMKDIAVSIFAPKPKETTEPTTTLGGGITFGDWVIPVTVIAVVAVVLVFVFLKR